MAKAAGDGAELGRDVGRPAAWERTRDAEVESSGSPAGSGGDDEELGDEVGVEGEALLLEPHAVSRELLHERWGGAQVEVRRPEAALGVLRDEGSPQVEGDPAERWVERSHVPGDCDAGGVEVAEQQDGHIGETREQELRGARVPARDVGEEPVRRRRDIDVGADVLDEEHDRGRRSHKLEPGLQGAVGEGDLAEHGAVGFERQGGVCAAELQAGVGTDPDDAVAGEVGVTEGEAALFAEDCFRVRPDGGGRGALVELWRKRCGEGGLALEILELLQAARGRWEAAGTLRNDGTGTLSYRLAAANPALTLDTALAHLAPGAEAALVVDVDLAALGPADRVLPIQIITSAGAILWSLQLDALPEAGNFRGTVSFEVNGYSLASSELTVDLDFRGDGTIAGRVDADSSLLWPLPLALTGTWTATGDISLTLRDRLPAQDWRFNPLARALGRELVLTGKRTAVGLEGSAYQTLTGLRAAPVLVQGDFALHRQGPLTGLVHAPDFVPEDAMPPTWLAPPGLDTDACDDLGDRYGTDLTLPEPSTACDACTAGLCSPADMMDCGVDLRAAAYNLGPVLAALHGGGTVKPPSGQWTWDDCTAETPEYNDEGRACLDITAMRCAHALIRRGSVETPGPWGEAFVSLAAIYAAEEALAADLLATEAQVDIAFAFKGKIGEPAPGAFTRELAILATDRERLAAARAPTLTPAFVDGLIWAEENDVNFPTADAHLAPLQLAADFARTTAQWARLAHRAGHNLKDVRAAVHLAAITIHIASAELYARLADNPAAAPGLRALGPALQLLGEVHQDLTSDATPFGYTAAYVPLALGPEDIAKGRSNFEAVQALAADEVAQFGQVADEAWQRARDYEQKTYTLETTALQIETEYDAKLRALCGSRPGETTPDLTSCGTHGGVIAELRATITAAGLRIRHAAQASENNLHAISVEEERLGKEVAIALGLAAQIEAAHGQIFQIKEDGELSRSVRVKAEATAECRRIMDNMMVDSDGIATSCNVQYMQQLHSGPSIFGFQLPDVAAMVATSADCENKQRSLENTASNQCASVKGQAGLQDDLTELELVEEQEIMVVNAEIDQAIRNSDLEVRRVASVALVKNIRAEGLLLAIEAEEAELTRSTAVTATNSAFQEVAALAVAKAHAVGLMIEDSPDNALTRPHFLQARLAAAGRVLLARERTIRRAYLALRALEYELNQDLPALRDTLVAARSPEEITGLMSCLAGIAEDYRLEHGYGQPYVTEVSLRADIFGMTTDIPDVDGSPATPAEQFAALLQDPLHGQADGSVALPFALSAFENAQFSTWLCDDRIDKLEVKLVGDYLGDKEAEVLLTRQGLAGVPRCDGADLPQWSTCVSYGFEREQIIIQAGVNDWGTAGANAGYAAWPVHGEQWTLTIPPAEQAPANLDLDLAHISDVVLRLHHRAGTIAPGGLGTFTPSCE